MPWGPSTVRAELARLEDLGLLEHPHTSAGRVPTNTGYRYYVDELLEQGTLPGARKPVELSDMRREVDEAMRATTEQLSQVTDLLALVTAPPIETATIHRVEVLALQPQVAMVVVITSTGGVTKRVIPFDETARRRAGRLGGRATSTRRSAGSRSARGCCTASSTHPDSSRREREFLAQLAPAFTELEDSAEHTLFYDGAARLISEQRFQELPQLSDLMEVLQRRRALLSILRASLSEPNVYLRIGSENPAPGAALAEHGRGQLRPRPAQPRRRQRAGPGADGLPAGDHRRPPGGGRAVALRRRGLRRVMRRDAYEVLGVERGADEREIKKRFRVLARELHPDVNSEPDAEERFKEAAEAYEVLCDPERRQVYDRYGWEGLDSRGYAPHAHGFGSFADIFDAFFGGDPFGGRSGGGPGPVQGGDVGGRGRGHTGRRVTWGDRRGRLRRGRGLRALPRQPRRARHADRDVRDVRRHRPAATPYRAPRSASSSALSVCDACGGEGKVAQTPCKECGGDGRRARPQGLDVDIPAGIADGQRVRLTGRGHAGERGGPPGDLYVLVRVTEDERFLRDGNDLVSVVDVPAPAAALGTTIAVPTLDGEEEIDVAAGTQPGTVVTLRGRGMPQIGRSRRGDQRVVLNVVVPRNLDARQRELLSELSDSLNERQPPRAPARVDRRQGPPGVTVIRLAIRAPAADAEPRARGAARARPVRRRAGRRRRQRRVRRLRRARRAARARARARPRSAAFASPSPGRRCPTTGRSAGSASTRRSWSATASTSARRGRTPRSGRA